MKAIVQPTHCLKVVPGSAGSISWELVRIQILRPCSRSTDSEFLGLETSILYFSKPSKLLIHVRVCEPLKFKPRPCYAKVWSTDWWCLYPLEPIRSAIDLLNQNLHFNNISRYLDAR